MSIYSPQSPFHSLFFDWDGTLSLMEGIDFLADLNDVGDTVKRMTQDAMAHRGISEENYALRLSLVQPHRKQLEKLKDTYLGKLAPQSRQCLALFKKLGKEIYILSAGLLPALLPFASYFGLENDHLHAVDIYFDAQGQYLDFDHQSLMVQQTGKAQCIAKLSSGNTHTALVGDGANDLAAAGTVTRFIGYGGVHQHPLLMQEAEFFIKKAPFSALLPLLLTEHEIQGLSGEDRHLLQEGLYHLQDRGLLIKGIPDDQSTLSG
ncbi:MAG: HAD-IB family phosphatase [Legionellaceae bacterium]|nr:HAD-IB family phosphatase [Legionellaceae bacterium]